MPNCAIWIRFLAVSMRPVLDKVALVDSAIGPHALSLAPVHVVAPFAFVVSIGEIGPSVAVAFAIEEGALVLGTAAFLVASVPQRPLTMGFVTLKLSVVHFLPARGVAGPVLKRASALTHAVFQVALVAVAI